MTESGRTVPRAEPVGSLLRPAAITDHIDALYDGMSSAWRRAVPEGRAGDVARLDELADAVVPDLVARQVDAGLDVVTDGEVRRSTFLGSFFDAVEGMAVPTSRDIMRDESGAIVYEGYGDPLVDQPIHQVDNPLVREAQALVRAAAPVPFKLTIPAPSYFYSDILNTAPGSSYATRRAFVDDVVRIEAELVREAVAAGATSIQFDFPLYPALADPDYAAVLRELHGESSDGLLALAIDADRRAAENVPDGVTVGMHICRGNMLGGFWNGSLEPVAEAMFNELPHERWLIEWEDITREGDFSPLRHVPAGKVIALGLVSTKTPELEADDAIVARIDEAARHVELDQLALCPQCGFASLSHDHLVSAEDAQWRKLELVGRVADRVWGSA